MFVDFAFIYLRRHVNMLLIYLYCAFRFCLLSFHIIVEHAGKSFLFYHCFLGNNFFLIRKDLDECHPIRCFFFFFCNKANCNSLSTVPAHKKNVSKVMLCTPLEYSRDKPQSISSSRGQ